MVNKKISIAVIMIVMIALLSGCFGNADPKASQPTQTTTGDTTAKPTDTAAADPAANWSDLKIKVLGFIQTGNNVPGDDVLTPIWRAKTKVIPEIVTPPPGDAGKDWMQKQVLGGTMPEVLAVIGQSAATTSYDFLKKNNQLREITKEDIIKYMPRTVAWLTKMGGTVDQYYADNVDHKDGKLWFIPNFSGGGANILPGYKGTTMYDSSTGITPYHQYIRDDVLKKIFPNVKTEKELQDLYIKQGGKLSYEDVTDIPIDNMSDLLDFLRKVKALNLKVGDKPVYASHIQSGSVNSLLWSAFSIPGYMWTITGERTTKGDQMTYTPITPEWKDYYKFWNTAYNEGLMDPESFIAKPDQVTAKEINGEYAMFNWWGPVNDARALAKKENRGYGFRYLPLFRTQPVVNKYQDFRPYPVSLDGSFSGVDITTKVKDKDLPQIMNWIDWNMSEEANNLRTWGLPEWSTGTGKDRRFKPEYKALEDWAVRGVKSAKDGNYYGLYDVSTNASTNAQSWNHETFGILGMGYPDSPLFTYPVDLTKEINLDQVINQVETAHFLGQMTNYHKEGWDIGQLDPDGKFDAVDQTNGTYSAAANTKVIKAIVGKPADFDKNYNEYLAVYNDKWKSEFALMQTRWKDIYDKFIAPQIEKAGGLK